jgi:hypothetical protein
MEEGAGILHAEGVDPGSWCEANTPVSIGGNHTEMFISNNLYHKSLTKCNVKRETNLEPKEFNIYTYISFTNINITLKNVPTVFQSSHPVVYIIIRRNKTPSNTTICQIY